jgi:circadian clock protein KaiC
LERLSTGSAAFDRILGGGIPVRSLSVISGEPGAGKTLFALQVLFHLARQGKKGLYFTTLSEPSLKLIQYMQQFAFFDERLIGKELVFSDLGSIVRGRDANAALEEVTSRVEQEEPAIVVIDSFKAMRDILGDAPSIRTFVYDLAVHTAGWGAATLFVGEYTEEEMANYAEFTIADGILRFSTRREALTAVRMVEVRGSTRRM